MMQKLKGFSLPELMIVVAIIGVLAVIGVPVYRTLVQKSRQSEAKNALGGVAKLETGFFGEHASYGNHLGRMGLDDLAKTLEYYSVGFMGGTCNDTPNGFRPLVTSETGSALNTSFPSYYSPSGVINTKLVGWNLQAQPNSGCVAGDVSADGQTFTAVANGTISLKSGNPVDGWTISDLQLVDLFPHTPHVEALVTFIKA